MEQEKLDYGVVIYRRDDKHIMIETGEDFEKCRALYTELSAQWENCHKDSIPFRLEQPDITSFEPGLIYEIKILAGKQTAITQMDQTNPYVQRMKQQGLAGSLPGQGNPTGMLGQPDIFDKGYQR